MMGSMFDVEHSGTDSVIDGVPLNVSGSWGDDVYFCPRLTTSSALKPQKRRLLSLGKRQLTMP